MLGVILVQIASFMMSKGQSAKGGWWILIFFGTMFVDTYTAAFETKGVDSFETLFPYIPVSKRDYENNIDEKRYIILLLWQCFTLPYSFMA